MLGIIASGTNVNVGKQRQNGNYVKIPKQCVVYEGVERGLCVLRSIMVYDDLTPRTNTLRKNINKKNACKVWRDDRECTIICGVTIAEDVAMIAAALW